MWDKDFSARLILFHLGDHAGFSQNPFTALKEQKKGPFFERIRDTSGGIDFGLSVEMLSIGATWQSSGYRVTLVNLFSQCDAVKFRIPCKNQLRTRWKVTFYQPS